MTLHCYINVFRVGKKDFRRRAPCPPRMKDMGERGVIEEVSMPAWVNQLKKPASLSMGPAKPIDERSLLLVGLLVEVVLHHRRTT